MTDIFGKTPFEYRHLRDAYKKSAECLSEYLQSSARKHENRPHNFDFDHSLLENASAQDIVELMNENRQALQDVVDEVLYVKNRHTEYLRMINERLGTSCEVHVARWTKQQLHEVIRYRFAVDDLRMAARSLVDHIHRTLFKGESTIGREKGFINLPATDVKVINTGTDDYFSITNSNTGEEMLEKLNQWMSDFTHDFIKDTNNTIIKERGMTIYLPVKQCGVITNKRLQDKTVWRYFQSNNAWSVRTGEDIVLREMVELTGAATTKGRTDRGIIALNNKDIMKWSMSLQPRVIIRPDKFDVRATIEYAFSPLQVKQPAGIRYIDGV